MLGFTMRSAKFLVLAVLVNSCICQKISKEELEGNNEFRLPDTVVPEHYDLKYTEIDFEKLTFSGTVKIRTTVKSETPSIVLHKGKLNANITSISANGEKLKVDKSLYNETTDFWSTTVSEPLKPKDTVTVDISFDGNLRDDMIGFYWSSYTDENGKKVFLAATQFEAAHARHAFPCFDEPALKATFTISIVPPAGYNCLSNMPHSKSEPKNECKFDKSVKMSTYLVAFVVSNFENVADGRVRLWSRPNALSQARYGAKIGSAALAYFEKLLAQPYPISKMDMAAVPDFSAGAMENWGLLTYRETAALYDAADSSAVAQQRVASVIVHECTHMWFGNLVTPKWWSYMWLSEAFARYYQYMATDQVESGWRMNEQFVVEQHQHALMVDAAKDSVPMTRPAKTQAEVEKMGGSITYDKGASIVRMMELTFGQELFNAALKEYLEERKYDSARPEDLWQAFQKQVNETNEKIDVSEIMKEWTEKPGFPYLSVIIETDKIKVEQKRFFISRPNEVPDTTWKVPISLLSSSRVSDISTKPVYWLMKSAGEFENKNKNDGWTILNVNSAGFYRVNYDPESWNKIINVLTNGNFEQIPVLNRAAILDDLLNLARAEILDYDVALRGIQYLRREKNYLPFKSALTSLDYLTRRFSTTSSNKTFNAFVATLFSKIYEELTYDDRSNDDRFTILLRQELNQRACKMNNDMCITKSKEYFKQLKTSNKEIPVNQRPIAYCTAIQQGSDEDWKFLWDRYINANVAAEQLVILKALGCSKNTKLLENYLLEALKDPKATNIRKQDVSTVFSAVYSSSIEGAEYMIDFAMVHAEEIKKYHGKYDEVGNLISGALKAYPTQKLIDKVNGILKMKTDYIQEIEASLKKSLEHATFELDWFNKHSGNIIKWIKVEENMAYRLPTGIIPTDYKLYLKPNIVEPDFDFDGEVEIIADVKSPRSKIVLHADRLNIERTNVQIFTVTANGADPVDVKAVEFEEKYHFINIELMSEISSKILIKIKYKGILNTEMRGFYRSWYPVENGKRRWLAATHLEPVGARRVFPCFDEPALKARFNIIVETAKEYFAISNTKLMKQTKKDDTTIYKFETTPIMSTYLVAVAVSDFSSVSSVGADKRNYTVYSNPLIANQLDYSLSAMEPTVKFFESRLSQPYELSKLDMIALPDFSSGAMENWGLMTFRETNLAYDANFMSSIVAGQSVYEVVVHEITHQWFGDLVSPLWWDYLWLSEGFARYFQYHAHAEEQTEASWNLESQFVVDALQSSFSKDASSSTHPITAKVYSPSEIRGIFDSISYAKAASVIRMLEKLVGSKTFFGALHNYLEKCKYSTGRPEALFEAFQNELAKSNKDTQLDVVKLMTSWTTTEGFPVVDVSLNNNKTTFQQSRFYLRPRKSEQKDQSIWIIPLSWTTGKNPNFDNTQTKTFLTEKSQVYQIDIAADDWIIFNLQQMGYYRVNYEPELWRRLIAVLNSNHTAVHEVNRAALLDDLLNLGRADYVDYELVLAAAAYLRHETEYAPWRAAYNGFVYLERRFSGRPEFYGAYRTFMMNLLESSMKRLGFEDVPKERHTDQLLRKLTIEWLAKLDNEVYVKKALQLFDKEKTEKDYRVPPNKQAYVYNTAIRYGTEEDWHFLYERVKKSIYATEKVTLLAACAQSRDPKLLKNILEEVIRSNSIIRLQDAKKVITNIIDSGVTGVKTVLDFFEANYKTLLNYLQEDTVKNLLSTASKRLSTKEQLDKFEQLVKSSDDKMPEISKSLQSYLKRAKTEMDWSKEKGPKILSVLNKKNLESEYRLPTFAEPQAYELWFTPYFEDKDKDKEFTFVGKAVIDIKVKNDTAYVVLQTDNLNIEKKSLNKEAPFKILDELTYYDTKTQKLYIYFDETAKAETKFQLTFEFNGKLREDMKGFYRSYYFDKDGNKKWIASTHFEPTYARRAFPCFDEPSFKAKFTVHISRPNGYSSLSNTDLSRKPQAGANRTWDEYNPTLRMSPYLLAFVVSDFVSTGADGSRVKTWSRADLKGYMSYSPIVGNKSLSLLEEFTKISYALNKMDFVAVPDFDMGAMENWGLVTYREYGLTFDTQRTSATYKRYMVTTIAHELVHQWFGNLVTCDWWGYAWLNEGFAEYISYIISDKIEPEWDLLDQFVVKELHAGLDADSLESSHPMNNNISTPAEAQATFDKITYQKAASVLRMLHHSFGKDTFESALHDYLAENAYRTGKPEYLNQAIKERLVKDKIIVPGNLKEDVISVIDSWTTQSGYPVVNAVRKEVSIEISQERFLISPSDKTKEENKIYWIPITYTTDSSKDFENTSPQLWLGKEPQQLLMKPADSWYILNIQEVGFYRVNYDLENWRQLVSVLNSERYTDIHLLNRAQILEDSLSLARAGRLDYSVALDASKYLTRETSHIAWRAYFNGVAYLAQRVEGSEALKKLFSSYIVKLVDNVYSKLGFEDVGKDKHLDQLNRELIVTQACKYGHENCLEQAKRLFKEPSISPNVAGAIYCYAGEYGSPEDWDDLWNKFTKTQLSTDNLAMLRGLGCSKNTTILEKYLNLVFEKDSKIRRQDVATALSSIYTSSQQGLEVSINYYKSNLDKLFKFYGDWDDVGSLFSSVAAYVVKEEQVKDFESLASEETAKEIKSSLEKAVQKAKQNLKWFSINAPIVQKWLEQFEEIPESTVEPTSEDPNTQNPTSQDPNTEKPSTEKPNNGKAKCRRKST